MACGRGGAVEASDSARDGRLSARPQSGASPLPAGRHQLTAGTGRTGFLYIPTSYRHGRPAPLLVLFHGAGQSSSEWNGATQVADQLGVVLVVPDSRNATWDRIRGGFGPDVVVTNEALQLAFRHCTVDPKRIGMGGFSDGASYALSLGLTNGDLISHVLAFSPGFMAPGPIHGSPLIYVTHGTRDQILPIDSTSRSIVPRLESSRYNVTYQEFDGRHELPREMGNAVFRWFAETGNR
jgi:phospholipase/carboxylesterase